MSDIDGHIAFLKTITRADNEIVSLKLSTVRVLIAEIERLREMNESLMKEKDEEAVDWYSIQLRDELIKTAMLGLLTGTTRHVATVAIAEASVFLADSVMKERNK